MLDHPILGAQRGVLAALAVAGGLLLLTSAAGAAAPRKTMTKGHPVHHLEVVVEAALADVRLNGFPLGVAGASGSEGSLQVPSYGSCGGRTGHCLPMRIGPGNADGDHGGHRARRGDGHSV